jgi:AcrR family transcriptional regulator
MAKAWTRLVSPSDAEALLAPLLETALARLEVDGAESLKLRDLARGAGVSHRKLARRFPDQQSLLARVGEEGWRLAIERIVTETAGAAVGEEMLVAGGTALFQFARERPNLFHLMTGPGVASEEKFPDLAAAMTDAVAMFVPGFAGLALPPDTARERAAMFVAALQGVTVQMLQRQLHVAPARSKGFITEVCRRLIKGLR